MSWGKSLAPFLLSCMQQTDFFWNGWQKNALLEFLSDQRATLSHFHKVWLWKRIRLSSHWMNYYEFTFLWLDIFVLWKEMRSPHICFPFFSSSDLLFFVAGNTQPITICSTFLYLPLEGMVIKEIFLSFLLKSLRSLILEKDVLLEKTFLTVCLQVDSILPTHIWYISSCILPITRIELKNDCEMKHHVCNVQTSWMDKQAMSIVLDWNR